MVRHDLRCVSCESCVAACPFGTIWPELVSFYTVPCDLCDGRHDGDGPLCARTCEHGAIAWREVPAGERDLHVLSEPLAVRGSRWRKREEEVLR
jgi:Fe-S-cluster-containing hydrogenase component 2